MDFFAFSGSHCAKLSNRKLNVQNNLSINVTPSNQTSTENLKAVVSAE